MGVGRVRRRAPWLASAFLVASLRLWSWSILHHLQEEASHGSRRRSSPTYRRASSAYLKQSGPMARVFGERKGEGWLALQQLSNDRARGRPAIHSTAWFAIVSMCPDFRWLFVGRACATPIKLAALSSAV